MKQTGLVSDISGDMATVVITRLSACEGCHQKENGCELSCFSGKTSKILLKNTLNAKKGDAVELYSPDGGALLTAFIVFILPIALAVAAYFLAEILLCTQTTCYIVMLASFLTALAVCFFGANTYLKKKPLTRMERII